ncbi:MAG: hypothetical protein FVQ80_05980 [Planctomycetes bacterium]|nr:hypothetical protein [Planctomycetota bacterium]
MIDKINNINIQDILASSLPKQNEPNKTSSTNQADSSLQVDYASLIEKAAQVPLEDENAVQQAQQLLESGNLDTMENVRAAAQNIIDLGI